MENLVVEWQKMFAGFVPKFLFALFIFLVSLYLARLVSGLLRRVLKRRDVDLGAQNLIVQTLRWSIIIYGTIMALQQFADVTAFLAGLGILGFTVGFALQDVMKNFVAGILLLLQRPFVIGDSVSVGEHGGTVVAIDLRSTEIKAFDGRTIFVPNADVLNKAIINYTRSVKRRIDLPVSVAYGSNLQRVRELTLTAIEQVPGVLKEPAPQTIFSNFGDATVNLLLQFWVDTAKVDYVTAQDTALHLLKKNFDENEITIGRSSTAVPAK